MSRTCLFVPAHEIHKVEKAIKSQADSIIIDLEDTVTPDKKAEARVSAIKILRTQHNKPISVRMNALSTPLVLDDLTSLVEGAGENFTMVCVPKIESEYDLKTLDWFLTKLEEKNNIRVGTVGIYPVIETATGLTNIEEIASASPRVKQLFYGMADLTSDLNLTWPYNGMEQLYVRTKVVLVSRTAGLEAPLDTIWPNISDEKGLIEDSKMAKALGYQGKTVIHPAQIEPVNEVFTPTSREIGQAQNLLSEFEKAEQQGQGAVKLENGQFVDYAFLKRAQVTVELAKRLNLT